MKKTLSLLAAALASFGLALALPAAAHVYAGGRGNEKPRGGGASCRPREGGDPIGFPPSRE